MQSGRFLECNESNPLERVCCRCFLMGQLIWTDIRRKVTNFESILPSEALRGRASCPVKGFFSTNSILDIGFFVAKQL